jgi:hypothetical protein
MTHLRSIHYSRSSCSLCKSFVLDGIKWFSKAALQKITTFGLLISSPGGELKWMVGMEQKRSNYFLDDGSGFLLHQFPLALTQKAQPVTLRQIKQCQQARLG